MVDFEDSLYVKAVITGHEASVKSMVEDFVDSVKSNDVDKQRIRLPMIRKMVGDAVSFIVDDMPVGVTKIDGYVVQPILESVVDKKIADLPVINVDE